MRQHDFWGRLTKVVEVVGAMSNLDQFGILTKSVSNSLVNVSPENGLKIKI